MEFPTLQPNLQISLYSRLQTLRSLYLREGLKVTVESDDFELSTLDTELSKFVPKKHLKRLAAFGLRGEVAFPVPYLIVKNPFLLGYYRLLLGFSQKAFYEQGPFSGFKSLEERGKMTVVQQSSIPALCASLIETSGMLLDAIDPLSIQLVHDLQVLTLGPQLRGSSNVDVGQAAVQMMHELLKALLAKYNPDVKRREMIFKNDSGHLVDIHFGGDPDVSITLKLATGQRYLAAIEIKGGTDVSNIWNRLGEAEKSHRSAKAAGFNELWTVTGVNVSASKESHRTAVEKSPTTTQFFFLPRIVDSASDEGMRFRQLLGSIIGANLD
jgi:hypothetical protein